MSESKQKPLINPSENVKVKNDKNNSRFRLFLAVIILLLALNVLIGNFLLVLPGDFSLKDISLVHFFSVPYIIIPNIGAIYAIFVAILLLRNKKKNLIETLLIVLLILLFIWLLWSVFFFYLLNFFGGNFILSIVNLVLSLTAIIAIIIFLIKNKDGKKNNEN